MECKECKKRPATLRFKQFVNGEEKVVHLCEVCAKEKGYVPPQDESYSLHDLLTGLFNFDPSPFSSQSVKQMHPTQELQCPSCEMTFSEFKKIGKFGCASCYDTFSEKIDSILSRIHTGSTEHTGKIPKRIGDTIQRKKEIKAYRSELKQLIEEEAFEEAAVVRDKIKAIEKGTDEEKERGAE